MDSTALLSSHRRSPALCQLSQLLLAAAHAALLPAAWAAPGAPQAGAVPDSAPAAGSAQGADAASWNLHGQFTSVLQYHPSFASPYEGTNSLDPGNTGKETVDLSLFGGARLWHGAAVYLNPEIDQGYGLSNTVGIAGFPSAEAYKVGARNPYFRLPRAFVRQIVDLGADAPPSMLADAQDQLPGTLPADNLTITAGKLSVTDIFDTNRYAHDPKSDFLNWAIVDAGAFDYPADSWAFTYGAAAEWTRSWWTVRGGFFALSQAPNSKDIDGQFHQFGVVAELEERHRLLGHDGKLKALGFINHGRMGSYDDAIALGEATRSVPDTALVRRYASRPGVALNLEQELAPDLGAFARASYNDGDEEAFDFTEINQSLSAGVSLGGARWQRADDAVGAAVAVSGLSAPARRYFADGGIGILIGDGRLPDYDREKIGEAYYRLQVVDHVALSLDLQGVVNPAYNHDRGPVRILALRLHAEF